MSIHDNKNQQNCWSCEFFSGVRKDKNGFLGFSVDTSPNGICKCYRSSNYNKSVSESNWCSKYQQWGVISSFIATKQNERYRRNDSIQRNACEQNIKQAREELEQKKYEAKRQKIAFKYNLWYASLSPEERQAEDLKIQQRKDEAIKKCTEFLEGEAERKIYIQEMMKKKYENQKRRKKFWICTAISIALVIVITIISVSIANFVKEQEKINSYNSSDTALFLSYMNDNYNFNNDRLDIPTNRDDGTQVIYSLKYEKSGCIDIYGIQNDFSAILQTKANTMVNFRYLNSYLYFNLEGSDLGNSFGPDSCPIFYSIALYGDGSVLTRYLGITYDSINDVLSYGYCIYSYEDWNESYDDSINEWTNKGWEECIKTFNTTNILFSSATGHKLYE